MKKSNPSIRPLSFLLIIAVLISGCSSSTMIRSFPGSADVYVNGEFAGTTPYVYRDSKLVGSLNYLRLEKEGYEPLQTTFSRNESPNIAAIIGGFFVIIPFFWALGYKSEHVYDLKPLNFQNLDDEVQIPINTTITAPTAADKLRELKQLLDEGLISKEDYETQKKKIIENI